jgi:hypothetical protein
MKGQYCEIVRDISCTCNGNCPFASVGAKEIKSEDVKSTLDDDKPRLSRPSQPKKTKKKR